MLQRVGLLKIGEWQSSGAVVGKPESFRTRDYVEMVPIHILNARICHDQMPTIAMPRGEGLRRHNPTTWSNETGVVVWCQIALHVEKCSGWREKL